MFIVDEVGMIVASPVLFVEYDGKEEWKFWESVSWTQREDG